MAVFDPVISPASELAFLGITEFVHRPVERSKNQTKRKIAIESFLLGSIVRDHMVKRRCVGWASCFTKASYPPRAGAYAKGDCLFGPAHGFLMFSAKNLLPPIKPDVRRQNQSRRSFHERL